MRRSIATATMATSRTEVSPRGSTRAAPGQPCRRRIYLATIDARLFALDAATGATCADFGDKGQVDLKIGLRRGPSFGGEYQVTSPPAVIDDLVIVGSAIADNNRVDAPSGEVRAFDARAGKLALELRPAPQRSQCWWC